MQHYCKTIGALAAASALVAGNASAEVKYELSAGYSSEYIFRGTELGQDLIETGVKATTEYNGVGLTGGIWHASYDTAGNASTTETDLYGEASYDLGFATGAIGHIWYINQDLAGTTADDAQETYFSLRREIGCGVQASLTYYWDVETDNNGYTELGLSKDIVLSPCLTLGLSSALGYAVEEGAVGNWVTKASLNWGFAENATLSPYVAVAVGGDVDSGYKSDSQNELFAGTLLTLKF